MSSPPFSLQTLISTLPLEDSQQTSQNSSRLFGGKDNSRASSRLASGIGWGNKDSQAQVTVESVEAWENNLYLGTSDGYLIHYLLDGQVSSNNNAPSNYLISRQSLGFGKRIVERITLFPQIRIAVIFCDSTLSFYSLPEMMALPTNFPMIKGVTCFCHDISKEGTTEQDGSVRICVMKKRMLHIYSLTDRSTEETSMQVPDGAITACQYGPYICVADAHKYKMINLSAKRMENLLSYESSVNYEAFKPIVTVVGEGEFLLALPANTGQMTMGQFISSTGDPIRGILQWQNFPRAIGVEFPYVVALLRNNVIEVHNIIEQRCVQSAQLPSRSRTISTGPGIKVQITGLMDRLKLESGYLLNKDDSFHKDDNISDDSKVSQQTTNEVGSSNNKPNFLETVPTRLIIAGSESVVALTLTPLAVQVDSMLDAPGHVEEALELAKRVITTAIPENAHSERMRHEFNYIHQKSGFIYLGETLFDFACPLFEEGKTDPRSLIQLFREMKDIVRNDDDFTVYSGVKEVLERLGSIEDIVSQLESAHDTQKLLIANAKEMLQKFLTKDREQRMVKGIASKHERNILRAVDNALLRLYVMSDKSDSEQQLNALLENSNECVLELSEKVLLDNKKYYPLSLLYKDNKEYRKALDIWKQILEVDGPDKDASNGLQQMANVLGKLDDRDLVWEYASWVIKQDETIGARIFIQPNLRRPSLIEPNLVLDQLRTVGKNGLKLYLEYLVTQRKSQEQHHHTELALLYIEEFKNLLQSDEIETKIEIMTKEFIKIPKGSATTYLSFLLNQPAEDLLSQGRAKLINFLQSSMRYDAGIVLNKLLEIQLLKAELAVVYGKLNEHEKALHILVDDLKDFCGAEIYCLYAGQMIGKSSSKKQPDKKFMEDKNLISTRRTLFLMLLKVYLEKKNVNEMIEKIINLLNTQVVYLDTTEVMRLLPEYWSVEMLSQFLVRSLRQSYHDYREGQILKGLCRGENTMTSFELYKAYQEIGPIEINQKVLCAICKEYISGSDFMRQPNSDIVHTHCNGVNGTTKVSDPLSNQA